MIEGSGSIPLVRIWETQKHVDPDPEHCPKVFAGILSILVFFKVRFIVWLDFSRKALIKLSAIAELKLSLDLILTTY
jgi:hypothetical protein